MKVEDFKKFIKGHRYIIYEIYKEEVTNKLYLPFEEKDYNITEEVRFGTFISLIPINYPHVLFRDLSRNNFINSNNDYKEMKKYITYTPLSMIKKIITLEEFIKDEIIISKLPSVIWDYICNFI